MSFSSGATFHTVFSDPAPLAEGNTRRMLAEYQDRWWRHDLFGSPAAMRQIASSDVSSLAELTALGGLAPSAQAYVRQFLYGTWRMESAACLRIGLPGGHTGLVGIFDPAADKVGRAELATLRVLSRQLSAICRGLPVSRPRTALARLSERQKQVVRLVADGLSNAQIAETLWLAEDTVKKYVSRILSTTGCQSRTELALLARSLT